MKLLICVLLVFTFSLLSTVGEALSTPEQQVINLINKQRVSGTRCNGGGGTQLKPLKTNGVLARAAESHAVSMGSFGFVSHVFKGLGPRERVAKLGYKFVSLSEIIYLGHYGGVEKAMAWWLNSPVHCRVIMSSSYLEVGAGFYEGAWVVVLALPK